MAFRFFGGKIVDSRKVKIRRKKLNVGTDKSLLFENFLVFPNFLVIFPQERQYTDMEKH